MGAHDAPSDCQSPKRHRIAFFDYPDVFEDFYPAYGVAQRSFATTWSSTGNHAFVSILQREIGDVSWIEFSLDPELEKATHEITGCEVRFFRSSIFHRWLWSLFYLPKPAWRWRRYYRTYATVASYLPMLSRKFLVSLRRDPPDFIFVQDYASGRFDVLALIARWLKIPIIAYHSGSIHENFLGRWARRRTLPWASSILPSSRAEADRLTNRYCVHPDRRKIILTPIDTEVFLPMNRAEACGKLNLDPARRYLLFVGRLDDPVKRISMILRSFSCTLAIHADVDLLIAGSGPDEAKLKQLASDLVPGRVRFLGWIGDTRQKVQLYNVSECLLIPSVREGFPTVVGEAMACGTPVLGATLDGIVELVENDRNGWLLRDGNDADLAEGIAHVLDYPDAARAMRSAARATAEERLSPATVARQLRSCFFPDQVVGSLRSGCAPTPDPTPEPTYPGDRSA